MQIGDTVIYFTNDSSITSLNKGLIVEIGRKNDSVSVRVANIFYNNDPRQTIGSLVRISKAMIVDNRRAVQIVFENL